MACPIEDDWVAFVPAAFLKVIEKISRLAIVAEAPTEIRTGIEWSSKHSPNTKSSFFLLSAFFLGSFRVREGVIFWAHILESYSDWNHTQHVVKDVLPSGAHLQFPRFLRLRGGISPVKAREKAIGGIVDL